MPLSIINRTTSEVIEERVWGEGLLRLLYGNSLTSKTIGRGLLHAFCRWPLFSWLAGKYYDARRSRRLIAPFIERFHIDMDESLLPADQFSSFNDFFTRRLKPDLRPQDPDPKTITIPADGRYSFIHHIGISHTLSIKGELLSLEKLLDCPSLASRFYGGTAVICRLCPADCHRFFFPCDAKASHTSWIHGSLFSVNPIATESRPWIWWSNRRAITLLHTEQTGHIAYIEVGATNCGSIVQNFVPNTWVKKGQEKGYFRLGGSAIILLFEPGHIILAQDLLDLSSQGHEILCHIGQPLARVPS